jgi:putative hydrolase of the HAD superfamily
MNNKKALILDLDYTIFPTNLISKEILQPFFDSIFENLSSIFSLEIIKKIENDLWLDSWDRVIEKYKIPFPIFLKSVSILESNPPKLEISTYDDYEVLQNLKIDKFLVTSGLTSLQEAKIKALKLEKDFKKIIINDRLIEKSTKVDIFKNLIHEYSLNPSQTYVIGDNPHAEIHAGNQLNLITIQILREKVLKGNNAKYYIQTFNDLEKIIF